MIKSYKPKFNENVYKRFLEKYDIKKDFKIKKNIIESFDKLMGLIKNKELSISQLDSFAKTINNKDFLKFYYDTSFRKGLKKQKEWDSDDLDLLINDTILTRLTSFNHIDNWISPDENYDPLSMDDVESIISKYVVKVKNFENKYVADVDILNSSISTEKDKIQQEKEQKLEKLYNATYRIMSNIKNYFNKNYPKWEVKINPYWSSYGSGYIIIHNEKGEEYKVRISNHGRTSEYYSNPDLNVNIYSLNNDDKYLADDPNMDLEDISEKDIIYEIENDLTL